jgi:hypothetical protein
MSGHRGRQCHFPARVTPIDERMKRFDRFAPFGKELETRRLHDRRFQPAFLKAFVMWGSWEGAIVTARLPRSPGGGILSGSTAREACYWR